MGEETEDSNSNATIDGLPSQFVKLAVLGTLGAWALVDPKTLSLPHKAAGRWRDTGDESTQKYPDSGRNGPGCWEWTRANGVRNVSDCGKYDACPRVSRQRLRSASKRPLERDRHVTSSANVLPEGRQDPGSR
ncbi:hypothetical protein F2P79_002807 [Pimephales promelas]|nr:hypothetical protein F2P79_002807 [Pimephales promelas]